MHYRRRVIAAALGFLVGVGLLLAGVVINIILIAVAGFAVMLACSLWAVTSYQRMTGITAGRVPAKDRTSGKKPRAAKGRPTGNHGGSGMMGRRRNAGGVARSAAANGGLAAAVPLACGAVVHAGTCPVR